MHGQALASVVIPRGSGIVLHGGGREFRSEDTFNVLLPPGLSDLGYDEKWLEAFFVVLVVTSSEHHIGMAGSWSSSTHSFSFDFDAIPWHQLRKQAGGVWKAYAHGSARLKTSGWPTVTGVPPGDFARQVYDALK